MISLSRRLLIGIKAPLLAASVAMLFPVGAHAQGMPQVKQVPATPNDMILYIATFGGDTCSALVSGADFPQAITAPTRNLALIFEALHGGKIPGAEGKKPTRQQLYNGASSMIAASTLNFCPENVPEDVKSKLKKNFDLMKKGG